MKTNQSAILIIILTTLFTSGAQIFYKFGVNKLVPTIFGILSNYYLIAGTIMYIVAGSLAIIAFRRSEVTVLYPIFATSYVWVSILSIYIFHETINAFNWIGIIAIISGVTFIGFGSSKSSKVSEAS